jgi:hypothetical protein
MSAVERLQLGRLGVFALCFGLLSCLIAPFVLPVRALLEPVGTDISNTAIKDSALLPVFLWCFGWPIALVQRSGQLRLRLSWALGSLLLLLHVAVAFHLGHGWSHEAAWEHTRAVGGYGDGVFVNYAFAVVWLIDAVWALVAFDSYRTRPGRLHWSIHSFLAFVVFNAAVVFGSWQMRALFAVAFLIFVPLSLWARAAPIANPEPSAATDVDYK